MLEGKSMPSNMATDTYHTTFLKNKKCDKISLLNVFPYVLCQFLASARFQLIV